MKTIAVLVRSFSTGGAQRVTANLCNKLVDSGFAVDAICLYELKLDYPVSPSVRIVDKTSSKSKVLGAVQRLLAILSVFRSRRYCAVIDLVPCFRYFNIARYFSNTPYITSERMYPLKCYSDKQLIEVERAYAHASLVIFQTEEQAQCFDLKAIKNYRIIPNAVISSLPISPRVCSPTVITAARMNKQKNLPMLIEAFAIMKARIPSAKLIIFGSSTKYDTATLEVTSRIDDLGLSDAVQIKDFSASLHDEMAKAMVFASSSDYEGIQNALLEAMTMGIPCVATDCLGGGARLVLDGGKFGHLVRRNDVNGFADALIEVAENYEVEKQRAEEASRILRDRFSEDVIYGEWVKAIESTVDAIGNNGNRDSM